MHAIQYFILFIDLLCYLFSLANFCGDRCENQNDTTSCLTCRDGFQAPSCCGCEEGYLSVFNVENDMVCCQDSIIEGTHNNCEYLNPLDSH